MRDDYRVLSIGNYPYIIKIYKNVVKIMFLLNIVSINELIIYLL